MSSTSPLQYALDEVPTEESFSDRPERQSISLEELAISNMWKIAAIVELLENKSRHQARPV